MVNRTIETKNVTQKVGYEIMSKKEVNERLRSFDKVFTKEVQSNIQIGRASCRERV